MGIYISKDIKYVRRYDLEKINSHIVIIDIIDASNCRIINVYRSFRPPGLMSPDNFFDLQIATIRAAINCNSIVLGDFNLDARMSNIPEYHRKTQLDKLNSFALMANLTQIVKFCTWSRTINGVHKESLLDHIYVNKAENVLRINCSTPTFGDHILIDIELCLNPT